MAGEKRGLVDKVKRAVARASTRGALTLVEGTAAAVRTVDRLQGRLSKARNGVKEAVVQEAPVVGVPPVAELKRATPRAAPTRHPVSEARETPSRAMPRTAGRKTLPVTEAAAKRAKAPAAGKAPAAKKPSGGGFKVKRGQKQRH